MLTGVAKGSVISSILFIIFINNEYGVAQLKLRPAWKREASTCGGELLPHADKHMLVYVLELCKSEAKRPASKKTPGPGSSDSACLIAASFRPRTLASSPVTQQRQPHEDDTKRGQDGPTNMYRNEITG
jgi:hypothetical protein